MTEHQIKTTVEKPKSGLFTGLKEYLDESFLPLGFERHDGDLGRMGNLAGANYIWEKLIPLKDFRTSKIYHYHAPSQDLHVYFEDFDTKYANVQGRICIKICPMYQYMTYKMCHARHIHMHV